MPRGEEPVEASGRRDVPRHGGWDLGLTSSGVESRARAVVVGDGFCGGMSALHEWMDEQGALQRSACLWQTRSPA